MMGAMDVRNMYSNLAVNICILLHLVGFLRLRNCYLPTAIAAYLDIMGEDCRL